MRTIFVANRAEIASRVFRTARRLGYRTAAAASQADRALPYTAEADVVVDWDGPSDVRATYLDAARVIDAAKRAQADLVHPGYGFLSENASFAEAVIAAGMGWIGPPPSAIRAMGDKASARTVAVAHGVPVVPGFQGSQDIDVLSREAARIGYPVLVKAVAGGGGRGMRRVERAEDLAEAIASARREALSAFGDDAVLLERYVSRPRHVEVQVMGDAHGTMLHLFERECSVQRRHQKIIEEAPSPAVSPELRGRMGDAAVRVAAAVGYQGAGTVEFLVDDRGEFYFLEMNTRLQVEHPVTEEVTGLDLVEMQIRVAEGRPLGLLQQDIRLQGHAIEVRLYAEDPNRGYLPSTGILRRLDLCEGEGLRVDAGFASGCEVSPFYDAMLAKLIARGPDRQTASRKLLRAVTLAWAPGLVTNLPLLREILAHPLWQSADLDTAFLERASLPSVPPLNAEHGVIGALALGAWQRHLRQEAPLGWRLSGRAEQHDLFRSGSSELTARWTPAASSLGMQVRVGDGPARSVRIDALDGDVLTLAVDGVRQRWRILWIRSNPGSDSLDDGDLIYVHAGDCESFVQLVPRFAPPSPPPLEAGQCASPTPGKVVAVHVAAGDRVSAGQRLVTIEAMKMEHAVTAPSDGTVVDLRVAVGDTVSEGERLVRIEG